MDSAWRARTQPLAFAALAMAALGCAGELLPASLVVNERVLAVVAEPPEAAPGQPVALTPLVVSPRGELSPAGGFQASWWRCPDEDSDALGDFVECSTSDARRDLGSAVPYLDEVPLDLFGAPPEGEGDELLPSDKLLGALLGYWRVVGFTMTVATTSGERRVEAFKRVPISLPVPPSQLDPRLLPLDTRVNDRGEALGPNTNPTLSAVLVHQGASSGPTTSKVEPGGTYFLRPVYDERALEPYFSLRVDLEGLDLTDPASLRSVPIEDLVRRFEKVQRCEIPTFSWFVTHGRVRRDTTVDEGVVARVFDAQGIDCPPVEGEERAPEVEYKAPTGAEGDPLPPDGVVRGWIVMRDGRGGTAVRAFEMRMELPE